MYLKKLLLSAIYAIIKKLNLKQLPGALFYNSLEYLEVIIGAEKRRKYLGIDFIAFVRPGFYWFFGNDIVIYKHYESRSLKADIAHIKWCRVGDLTMTDLISMGAPHVTMNFKQDDLVEYMQKYISPDLTLDSWITVFYCKQEEEGKSDARRLRGAFMGEVIASIELHKNLLNYPIE